MKHLLILIALSLSTTCIAQPKNFVGIWQGTIDVGVKLRIGFNFTKDGVGNYKTTMDSPDQSAFGIPTDNTFVRNDSIFTGIEKMQVSFAGKWIDDTTISGSFKQTISIPLLLKKVSKITTVVRKQTPATPHSYTVEDVSYSSGDIKIAGTLSYPSSQSEKNKDLPAILLITGSGPQNRDEEIMGHKPFTVIADHLTKKGFMVLRVDDRGTGLSTGDFNTATSADFADDADAGINFLKNRKEVDKKRIGLLGHSEGGMIAQIVAARRKDVDFLIFMASPGIKPIDLMTEQNLAIFETMGISEKTRSAYGSLYRSAALAAITGDDSLQRMQSTAAALAQWLPGRDSSVLRELGLQTLANQKTYIENFSVALSGPWYKYFLSYDPAPNLRKIEAKVLAINGDRDVQVLPKSNLAGIEAGLKKTKSQYQIHTIPGVNHLFQTCKTCMVTEYGMLEETISPNVLELIGSWLEKEVQSK